MKKVLSLLTVACMMLCLCACGSKTAKQNKIAQLASSGKMTESQFDLGTDIAVIKNAFSDGKGGQELLEYEGASTVKLSIDNFDFHYYKEQKDNGISVIVNFSDAYGFETGQAMSDDIISVLGQDYNMDAATDDQLYFLPSIADNCEVLTYTFGDYTLNFYFIDYFLSATTLINTKYWA